jgi:ubiquitin carboxyl-terminal hydrolase 34
LAKLPADGRILAQFEDASISYKDIFPQDEIYKSLYAMHALRDYIATARQGTTPPRFQADYQDSAKSDFGRVLARAMSIIVQSLSDEALTDPMAGRMRLWFVGLLLDMFLKTRQGSLIYPITA